MIALWHLFCSLFVAYLALWPKNAGLWFLLPIALIPISLLISYIRSKRWNIVHRGCAVVALLPAIWIAGEEFFRPYSPNRPWLWLVLSVYFVVLIGSLIIKENPAEQAAHGDADESV